MARASTDLDALLRYFAAHGISVLSTDRADNVITARGSNQDLSSAFGVRLSIWHERVTGEEFTANDRPIALPATVDAAVLGVLGLDDSVRLQPSRLAPPPPKPQLMSTPPRRCD